MAKRKALSADEKRERVLKIFHEKKELKDVEKLVSKERGVVPQAVKGILKEFVDESLVDSDKIGSSVYYWAFPSKAGKLREASLSDLREKSKRLHQTLAESLEKLEQKQPADEEDGNTSELMFELNHLREAHNLLAERCKILAENDPEILDNLNREIQDCKVAINRWTDNMFNIRGWVKKKFGFTDKQVEQSLGIPEDLDYVE